MYDQTVRDSLGVQCCAVFGGAAVLCCLTPSHPSTPTGYLRHHGLDEKRSAFFQSTLVLHSKARPRNSRVC